MDTDHNKKIWLNVTGCPRSGTTALGGMLNQSKSVALLHEHNPKDFFNSIESFFKNQDFHRGFGSFNLLSDSMLIRQRDCIPLVESVFFTVFNKSASIVGTKFPGLQRWEKASYPSCVEVREIQIVRNPVDVVNSYTIKGDGTVSEDPEHAFCDWLHSFNHTILNQGHSDFLWLLYESFKLNENHCIAESISNFLGISLDFDLAEMDYRDDAITQKFLECNSGDVTFDAINRLFDMSNWKEDAVTKVHSGRLIGYPLAQSEYIDLTCEGNSWKYIHDGFYAPEINGAWTRGAVSVICFSPEIVFSGGLVVTLDVSFSIDFHDVGTVFKVYLDDALIGKVSLLLDRSNGGTNLMTFNVEKFEQQSASVTLKVVIENPRNPADLGFSDDDRDLGIMIRSISFACPL